MTQRLYDYAASANCFKVRLLLAQLRMEYERVPIDIFAGKTLGDEYAAINPMRTTPVLEPQAGRYLAESNAILVYLGDGTPFMPDDGFERAHVLRWLFFEQADVVPSIGGLRFRLLTGRLDAGSEGARRRRAAAEEVLAVLDAHLDARAYLVGERYSVADIGVYGYVHVADEAGLDLRRYPGVVRWLDRVAEQPHYMNDLEPYPPNARRGVGRSIYD
jgi:glutathione S-transferase